MLYLVEEKKNNLLLQESCQGNASYKYIQQSLISNFYDIQNSNEKADQLYYMKWKSLFTNTKPIED